MKQSITFALLVLLIAVPGHGQNVLKRVAVLEFGNPGQAVTDAESAYFTELVRNAARPALPRETFLLLTRESIEEMMPEGVTLLRCNEATCELEVGRMLKVDYIITGSFARLGDGLRLTARVYDVASGNLLQSQMVKATDIEELEVGIEGIAPVLLAAIPGSVVATVPQGGGAFFVTPTQPGAPLGEAELRKLPPSETPPATATGPAGLYITTDPPGAEVYLGTTQAGTTTPAFQMVNFQAGTTVRVTLKMDLYHDVAFDVNLKPGVTKFENVELKPAFGSLTIKSDPPGAKVLIGGVAVGTTPYTNPRYPSGDYLVGLELDEYLPIAGQMIAVRDGEATSESFALSANFGTLSVESDPPGATVTLNGNVLGTTPGTWRVAPVQNGTIEISRAGYRPESFAISVDREQTVKIGTAQATLARKVGSLQVYADPPEPGAKVFLDGVEVGAAPLTLNDVGEGQHEVRVETEEKTGTEVVVVGEGQSAVATVVLEPNGGLNADGSVWVDNTTNLMWQVSPISTKMDWNSAYNYCFNLDLGGFSDWTLPKVSQLRSIVRGCPPIETSGSCGLTDPCLRRNGDVCFNKPCWKHGCWSNRGPGEKGAYLPPELHAVSDANNYWSFSQATDLRGNHWTIDFERPGLDCNRSRMEAVVRCVRRYKK